MCVETVDSKVLKGSLFDGNPPLKSYDYWTIFLVLLYVQRKSIQNHRYVHFNAKIGPIAIV